MPDRRCIAPHPSIAGELCGRPLPAGCKPTKVTCDDTCSARLRRAVPDGFNDVETIAIYLARSGRWDPLWAVALASAGWNRGVDAAALVYQQFAAKERRSWLAVAA